MNVENHRVLLAFLPADGLYQKTINVPAIGALVSQALDIGNRKLLPQRVVQAS